MRRLGLFAATGLLLAGTVACSVTEGDPGGIGGSGGIGSDGPVSVSDLGSETISPDGVDIEVTVPDGAVSFALVVDGAGSELVLAETVTSPSDTVWWDFENDININRTDATDGLYTLLVPTSPDVLMEGGDWIVRLRSGSGTFDGSVTAVIQNEANTDNMLDLNLYFVGLDGLDAATAESDTGFQGILSNVVSIYSGAGAGVRAISYNDVSDAALSVIDSDAELATLFQQSPNESNRSVNLFFVSDITTGGGGFSTLGLAGGVPGPPVLQGTSRSGVAINMGNYMAAVAAADQMMIDEATAQLEIIAAHETGHFLGLYHTTEKNGLALTPMSGSPIQGEDPLSDTPLCADTSDSDMDGTLSPTECGASNLMFWSPPNDARTLTSQQGTIMLANPVVY
jgi:hypothetical protein